VPRLGAPTRFNERWSLDFVLDVLDDGRRFRILTVVDDSPGHAWRLTSIPRSAGGVSPRCCNA
jgi:hypothetical protein